MTTLVKSSGEKSAAIELEKEIEPSATKTSIVTATLVYEAKAAAAVQILVNKKIVAEANPGEPVKAALEQVTFAVEPKQKYEIKKATGLKEAVVSVATVEAASVETLEKQTTSELKKLIEAEQIKLNEEYLEELEDIEARNAEMLKSPSHA
jgi:hypothetical protein